MSLQKHRVLLSGQNHRLDRFITGLSRRLESARGDNRGEPLALRDGLVNAPRLSGMALVTVEHRRAADLAAHLVRYAKAEGVEANANLAPWVKTVVTQLDQHCRDRLHIPPGHRYECELADEEHLIDHRYANPHTVPYDNSVSAFVHRAPPSRDDREQVAVELRVFLDRPHGHLFARQGPRLFLEDTDLLAGREAFLYGENHAALITQAVERANTAMARAGLWDERALEADTRPEASGVCP